MKLKKQLIKILPLYGWIPLIVTLSWNMLVYGGAKIIAGGWHHYNIESAYDRMIPFVPWTVSIYFGCYFFWIANYILCVRQGKQEAYRFLSADFLAKCVCLVFFLLFPTTNTRPQIEGNGFWQQIMRFLYCVDSADNLFPSIHCLVSWLSYIGIRGRKNVPLWYRIFSCIMAIAVFISTLTTKQHVIVDVAAGWLLAEVCYWITGHTSFAHGYGSVFEYINQKILKIGEKEVSGER